MMKFLLLAAVVLWLFYSPGVRRLMRSLRTGEPAASPPASPGPAEGKASRPQEMVACAHCGVHLPREDATLAEGEAFCSESHRRAGARRT